MVSHIRVMRLRCGLCGAGAFFGIDMRNHLMVNIIYFIVILFGEKGNRIRVGMGAFFGIDRRNYLMMRDSLFIYSHRKHLSFYY